MEVLDLVDELDYDRLRLRNRLPDDSAALGPPPQNIGPRGVPCVLGVAASQMGVPWMAFVPNSRIMVIKLFHPVDVADAQATVPSDKRMILETLLPRRFWARRRPSAPPRSIRSPRAV